ncbi:MAG: dihydrodipicolinate synthase family protein, partial [Paracoccaceae bacterium]
ITLTAHAANAGTKGALLLPPFYYKEPDDEGLYRYYSRVIEGVANDDLRMVLYHIPQISFVPISHDLIHRLMRAFPGIVCGIKDSSGDLENMQTMCRRFPDLAVLAGADPMMLDVLQAGGAGCITATTNVGPGPLRTVWDNWQDSTKAEVIDAAQEEIVAWRALANSYAQIPTTKAMIGRIRGDMTWTNLRPPFVEISDEERADVFAKMAALET